MLFLSLHVMGDQALGIVAELLGDVVPDRSDLVDHLIAFVVECLIRRPHVWIGV